MAGTAVAMGSGAKRKRPHKHACGVPDQYCQGSYTGASSGLKKSKKLHGSPLEAFNCYANYLIKVEGCKQIGPREFARPNGGPIVVLTKKQRFGSRLRGGKADRQMPGGRTPGGHIIC
jgi:hypothetical protein